MRRFGFLLISLLLTACGSANTADLPTPFQLPTQTNTAVPPPTLPATWTFTPTITPSPTATATLLPTVTPSATITDTPIPTATSTPSITPDTGAVSLLLQAALQFTPLPSNLSIMTPVPGSLSSGATPVTVNTTGCAYLPAGGFGVVFTNSAALVGQIGCPTGNPPVTLSVPGVTQIFERGFMIWLQGAPSVIYVFPSDSTFTRFDDTFVDGVDPYSGGEIPPPGLSEPVRGFGKVWRANPAVRTNLGWAVTGETAEPATMQIFDRGRMIYFAQRGDILVLTENAGGASGTWISVPGRF